MNSDDYGYFILVGNVIIPVDLIDQPSKSDPDVLIAYMESMNVEDK